MRRTALLILAAVVLAGCEDKPQFTPEEMAKIPLAKREGLPEASGGFTLAVGDQTITSEEVIGPVFEKLAPVAAMGKLPLWAPIACIWVIELLRTLPLGR